MHHNKNYLQLWTMPSDKFLCRLQANQINYFFILFIHAHFQIQLVMLGWTS